MALNIQPANAHRPNSISSRADGWLDGNNITVDTAMAYLGGAAWVIGSRGFPGLAAHRSTPVTRQTGVIEMVDITPHALANAVMGKLYDALTTGDATVPRRPITSSPG